MKDGTYTVQQHKEIFTGAFIKRGGSFQWPAEGRREHGSPFRKKTARSSKGELRPDPPGGGAAGGAQRPDPCGRRPGCGAALPGREKIAGISPPKTAESRSGGLFFVSGPDRRIFSLPLSNYCAKVKSITFSTLPGE